MFDFIQMFVDLAYKSSFLLAGLLRKHFQEEKRKKVPTSWNRINFRWLWLRSDWAHATADWRWKHTLCGVNKLSNLSIHFDVRISSVMKGCTLEFTQGNGGTGMITCVCYFSQSPKNGLTLRERLYVHRLRFWTWRGSLSSFHVPVTSGLVV